MNPDYINEKMLTIRLSLRLHDQLADDAHARRTSMNRHCIDLLSQKFDQQKSSELIEHVEFGNVMNAPETHTNEY